MINEVFSMLSFGAVDSWWLLAVSSGFGDQVRVVSAWRVDEGMIVSLAA
jgi:hypothetical protein